MQWTAAGEEIFYMLLSIGICCPTPRYCAILQHIGTSQNEQAEAPNVGIRRIDTKSYHRPEIGLLSFFSGILQGIVHH